MINAIAQKIGAPAFAYTNCAEVRRVRMRMMPLVPALFARDLKRSDGKGGFRIRQTLLPMEAVYLFASVIDQKLWNPDFQLTSQERRAKWAELHSTRSLRPSQANPRTNDLFSALETAATQESAKDLARFACDGLTRMLVARIPEGGK